MPPSSASGQCITSSTPNLYQVLGYNSDQGTHSLSTAEIRTAYKQALLENHPDKRSQDGAPSLWTIDTISLAYRVLSDPKLRKEYHELLLTARSEDDLEKKFTAFRTGLETVDLDDLAYDEAKGLWSKPCRCGAGGGYLVSEDELEAHADDGEIIAGCKGCSLWIRVLFSVER